MNYGKFINSEPCVISNGVAFKLKDLAHQEFEDNIISELVRDAVKNRNNIVPDDCFVECLND